MTEPAALAALAARLGHSFQAPDGFLAALTHPSWRNENPDCEGDFERLEFLGDAVLELLVTEALFRRHADLGEGPLTRMRAAIVNEAALAAVARDLGIPGALRLGRGEEASGGRDKPSILSDAVEAVVGAVFLDAGFEGALQIVMPWFAALLDGTPGAADHKSRLQARVQAGGGTVQYRTISAIGPDHDKEFEVALFIGGQEVSRGQGRTKKDASQEAARRALADDRFGGDSECP